MTDQECITCYPFPSNRNWLVFFEKEEWGYFENGKIDLPNPTLFVSVLEPMKALFEQCFGADHVNRSSLSILSCTTIPTIFRDQKLIFLSSKGRKWNWHIYQFAHELCHMMIPGQVTSRFRWFEESVCELASLFFLNQMAMLCSADSQSEFWKEYAPFFNAYADNRIKTDMVAIPCDTTFARFFADNLDALENNCYLRSINLRCAYELLPIFNEHPNLWQDVTLLDRISPDQGFMDSLTQWHEIAQCKDAVSAIIELFT